MIREIAKRTIKEYGLRRSFYVYDIAKIKQNVQSWKLFLPQVQPFYAMKCNPDPMIMKIVSENGFGFDCASLPEIEKARRFTDYNNIIYANPCKHPDDITDANTQGVKYTTFDSVSEVHKLKDTSMGCLLRIRINNPDARVPLSDKYGAEISNGECWDVITAARKASIPIQGVSFHVGSDARDQRVFQYAIDCGVNVLKTLKNLGFSSNILDIGGGFTSSNFYQASSIINETLSKHYPISDNLRIIAEPGRLFAEESATFFTPIIGKRLRNGIREYWICDGMYGSFNCMIYDKQFPKFYPLTTPHYNASTFKTRIYGQTCDSFDELKFSEFIDLPELQVGDWLMIPNFGAYTIAAATDFNGMNMTQPHIFYMNS